MNSSSSRMSPRTSWGFASCDFSCSTIMLLMFTPSVAGGRGRPSPGSRRPMLDVGYRSFRTETGRLYDGWPSFSFPLHERICLDRGRGPCLDTYLGQRLDDFALFERLLQCDIELLDHGRGRSFGRGEAEPDINVKPGSTVSAKVGISGYAAGRWLPVVASARILFSDVNGSAPTILLKASWILPAIRSPNAPAMPG